MTPVSATELVARIFLSALFGAIGQFIRLLSGLQKAHMAQPNLTLRELIRTDKLLTGFGISLAVGACAGIYTYIDNMDNFVLDKDMIMLLISTGYIGTDVTEGLLKKKS